MQARGQASPIRFEAACSPPDSRITWCCGGNRGIADGMDHRELRPQDGWGWPEPLPCGERFVSAAEELLCNIWKGFVSASRARNRKLGGHGPASVASTRAPSVISLPTPAPPLAPFRYPNFNSERASPIVSQTGFGESGSFCAGLFCRSLIASENLP